MNSVQPEEGVKAKVIIVALLLTGCIATVHDTLYPPDPVEPEPATEPAPAETPDETFVREFDACWAVYKECLTSGQPESVCFPPHEKCAIEAYRKLKKARGE